MKLPVIRQTFPLNLGMLYQGAQYYPGKSAVTDIVDSATRSRMMAGIRGGNTLPERLLRSALHKRGFRFRLHAKKLSGKPDLVFPRFKAVVFVHGCFWHRHSDCPYASMPATRAEFWEAKFAANVERDSRNRESLLASGWRVAVVWECALRKDATKVFDTVSRWLREGNGRHLEI